jgi:hypothetical protein
MLSKCPHCQFTYTITPADIGRLSRCLSCQQDFTVQEFAPANNPQADQPPQPTPSSPRPVQAQEEPRRINGWESDDSSSNKKNIALISISVILFALAAAFFYLYNSNNVKYAEQIAALKSQNDSLVNQIKLNNDQITTNINDNTANTDIIKDKTESLLTAPDVLGNWSSIGKWAIQHEISLLGDVDSVLIVRLAENEVPVSSFSSETIRPMLFIACDNKETYFVIHFGITLKSDTYKGVSVEYKIDNNNIIESYWTKAPIYEGILAKEPIELLKQLLNATKISFRVPIYDSSGVLETYFYLDDLDKAIVPVQAACGWK